MLKKSLHDQIKIIGFWTFGGVFWYLVIAFFLKSKYPIFDYSFNLENAYDVIKDALTLAASFLAPVAAFVLFTDWRDEHRAISNEKLSKQISDIISKISPLVGVSYINFDDSEKIVEFRQEYFSYLFEMGRNLIGINSIDKKSEKFIKDTQELNNLLVNIWLSLERQIVINQQLLKLNSTDARTEALKASYNKDLSEAGLNKDRYVEEYLRLASEISILHV
ncbi:hypothetical protein J9896_12635 [Acinetobacter baumannii]|uniref:hypothetical protein n=1 Tax=Acinetobacter baumannii TaxID=470 RepID=UPI001B33B8EF|nr:hypothetical protein [Acinetobacter baumannii]MBP4064244.1 hypothetical protein [Acinetobacter baumannii]